MHTQDPQRELQKLHMLQAMGLRLYLPRYRLPGAAPSRVIPWGNTAAPTTSTQASPPTLPADTTPPRPAAPEHRTARAAPRIIVDDTPPAAVAAPHAPATDTHASAPTMRNAVAPGMDLRATPAAPSANAAAEPMARFQALLLPLAGPVAVLALVPAVARLQLPERERRLLRNILHWLGVSEAVTQAPRPFQWPLPGLSEANAAQAGESLNAFLDQARRELGFDHLLIFGEPLHTALGTTAASHGMVATYSLQQMTTVPALKRECWLALQPLQCILADAPQ